MDLDKIEGPRIFFFFKNILKKTRKYNQDNCGTFIDLEKAFNKINRQMLQKVFGNRHYYINIKFIGIVKNIFKNCISKIKNKLLVCSIILRRLCKGKMTYIT